LCVILNGKAASDPAVRAALEQIRRDGHHLKVRVTRDRGDAVLFAAESAAAGLDLTVAAGGDGTINEVVNGIMASESSAHTALAIVPLGSANDFARACGIPVDDPVQSLLLAVEGRPRFIDVGQADARFFVNLVSAGFGAEAAARTPELMKRVLGGAAYPVTGLATAVAMVPRTVTIITEEGHWQEEMIHMAVANGRLAGGGIPVAPKAQLDDGLLDLVVIRAAGLQDLAALVLELGRIGEPDNRHITYRQLASLRLELDERTQLNVDGEPMDAHALDFRVHPRRLAVVLPPGAPMSQQQP
jgi:lipid kinase YegS